MFTRFSCILQVTIQNRKSIFNCSTKQCLGLCTEKYILIRDTRKNCPNFFKFVNCSEGGKHNSLVCRKLLTYAKYSIITCSNQKLWECVRRRHFNFTNALCILYLILIKLNEEKINLDNSFDLDIAYRKQRFFEYFCRQHFHRNVIICRSKRCLPRRIAVSPCQDDRGIFEVNELL